MLQMCGPTGIGFLFGKSDLLSAMPPFLGKFLYSKQFCICVYDSYDADGNLQAVSNFFFFLPISTGGGEMISDVFLDHSTFADPPSRLVDLFKY